jgi:hypothetical protein
MAAVYVDQFNLISFFTHYHNWDWHFVGRSTAVPAVYMSEPRDKEPVIVPQPVAVESGPGRPDLVRQTPSAFNPKGFRPRRFSMRASGPGSTIQRESALANQIISLAAARSLCIEAGILGPMVHADFKSWPLRCGNRRLEELPEVR